MHDSGSFAATFHRRATGDVGAGALCLTCARLRPGPARPRRPAARLIAGDDLPGHAPSRPRGPFYFDPELVAAGHPAKARPGVPLRLRLQIVDAADCAPSGRARVDIWHCDAAGAYSGYDRERTRPASRWLRGTQFADAEGVAAFDTLYPGWYEGRGAAHPLSRPGSPTGAS